MNEREQQIHKRERKLTEVLEAFRNYQNGGPWTRVMDRLLEYEEIPDDPPQLSALGKHLYPILCRDQDVGPEQATTPILGN